MKNVLELAEVIYHASRNDMPKPEKMPESVRELAPHTQRMYRRYAEAITEALKDTLTPAELVERYAAGELTPLVRATLCDLMLEKREDFGEAATPKGVLDFLAEQLAWNVNNPMGGFNEAVRDAFEQYAEIVGVMNLSDEVKKAMAV